MDTLKQIYYSLVHFDCFVDRAAEVGDELVNGVIRLIDILRLMDKLSEPGLAILSINTIGFINLCSV